MRFLFLAIGAALCYNMHKKCKNSIDPQEVQKEHWSGRKEDADMTEKALEARRAYKREWQRNNPDKVRAQQERYWAKKAACAEQETEQGKGAENEQDKGSI